MPGASAAVMAHELGHNFGFEHDDEIGNCDCDDPNERCIMNSYARLAPTAKKLFSLIFNQHKYVVDNIGLSVLLGYTFPHFIMLLFTPHYILISLMSFLFTIKVKKVRDLYSAPL